MTARASNVAALMLAVALAADAQEGETTLRVAEATARAIEEGQADAVAGADSAAAGRGEIDTDTDTGRARDDVADLDPLSTTPVDEEVVVRGQLRRSALRAQIELAEDAFFSRFNDINSDDEFDIHCRKVVELGSRIPRRRCEANFWRDAQGEFARETVVGLQGGYAADPQSALARGYYKRIELEKEMRELAATDAGLREALARLATLQEAYRAQND